MPSYEYRCRTCDVSFEVRREITAPVAPTTPCPHGHPETSRVFSAVAVTRGASAGGGRSATAVAAPPRATGGGACCGGGCCG